MVMVGLSLMKTSSMVGFGGFSWNSSPMKKHISRNSSLPSLDTLTHVLTGTVMAIFFSGSEHFVL
jgi:hypothetical protein